MIVIKKFIYLLFLLSIVSFSFVGCKSTNDEQKNKDFCLSDYDYYYEGIFLNNSEITTLFNHMRVEEPFNNVNSASHVSTKYMPETLHSNLYGKKVKIHITKYKIGTVISDTGYPTSNEGFKVELESKDEELQELLDSYNNNYHITGTYQDGEKYTEQIDFSDGKPVDIYINGVFGLGLSGNSPILKKI